MRNFFDRTMGLVVVAAAIAFSLVLIASCGSPAVSVADKPAAETAGGGKAAVNTSNQNAGNKNANEATKKETAGCTLTKAPDIDGFSLGQTVEEIDGRIPGFKETYEKEKDREIEANKKANFVVLTIGAFPEDKAPKGGNFDDRGYIWHFLDDKLVGYVVKDLTEEGGMIDKIVKESNLPADGWKNNPEDSRTLKCEGFEVLTSTHPQSGPSVMVFDLKAEAEKKKRGL